MPFAIRCIKDLKGFTLIFCFNYFNSNRCFDSFLGKFTAVAGIFLTRAKNSSSIFGRVINTPLLNKSPRGIPKDSFSGRFSKFLEKSL